MNKKTAAPREEGSRQFSHLNNTSIRAQRERLLSALIELGSVNTLFARDRLNVMHPGGRVMELRRMGHGIITQRITIHDRDGRRHINVARYILIRLAQEEQQ